MSDDHQPRPVTQAGVDLVKRSEGFSATPYTCPAGHPTIGYGHRIKPGEVFREPIGEAQAEELLRADLAQAAAAVERLVGVPLDDGQFAALASFVFNLGAGNLAQSTLLKKLNAGDYAGAAEEFGRWVKSGGQTLPGLVARRAAEAALFKGGAAGEPG
ncbi:MAG: lysozyme [Thermodesulfobacteriota bacterium]